MILIWSNVSQLISAKYFSVTLKKYQALVSYSMKKTKVKYFNNLVSMHLLGSFINKLHKISLLNNCDRSLKNLSSIIERPMVGFIYIHGNSIDSFGHLSVQFSNID